MHIRLVVYGSLDTVSGGYLYDRKLVETLREDGDRVEIIGLPWRDYARHLSDNLSASLPRRLESSGVDLLLQDELNHPSLVWTNRRLRRKFPILSIVHHLRSSEQHPGWLNRLYRRIEQGYLSSVDGFIFNSQTTRRAVSSLLGAEQPGLVAYPAGDQFGPPISEEEIAHRSREPGPLRLLFVGNLIPRKGLHVLLEALARLPPGSWNLDVVGSQQADPRYARRVRRRADELGLSGQVSFCGSLDDDQLAARLRLSHALALPSSYEGYGIAYLEGMGFGLPAIATCRGAAGEIITSEVDGFLVEPGDVQALSLCLREMIADRGLLLKLSLAARQRFESQPTWQQTTRRIRNFLADFLEEWSARHG